MKNMFIATIKQIMAAAAAAAVTFAAVAVASAPAHAAAPKEIRLDYAYYSPLSLIIRKHQWLEDEFGKEGVQIKWVLSLGSNRALEYLNSGSSDFGSTSGISALVSRANGYPVKTVYIFNTQEASALLVPKDSPIRSIADLKGKKVAATKGTDPFFFLLRTLHASGLRKNDVEVVHLQHPDGRIALEQGRVHAWAGLDPHMAASELEAGSRVLYRNAAFSSYGFLNTTDDFIARYPEHLKRVLKVYERARRWAIANPEETARIVADESRLSVPVIRQQLTRADFSKPVPEKFHLDSLYATVPILLDEEIVKKGTDLRKFIGELVDDRFAKAVVQAGNQ
jgi:sulfonate transport system substrate-binding protein